MNMTPTNTTPDPMASLVVFWTMVLMLVVLMVGIFELGKAFLTYAT